MSLFTRRTTILLLLLLWAFSRGQPVAAQDGDPRAGLLVQFGPDSVQTFCVDLGADGQATGEEVLRAAGLGVTIDYSTGLGGTVCKIGNQGCNYPGQACFCECSMQPGDPCVYWVYFHLQDGQWRYAIQGANSYVVRSGDVEGWVWGPGSATGGTQPPVLTFDQICGAAPAPTAPAPTVAATAIPPTQPPTAPPATRTVAPTATRTRTPDPTETEAPVLNRTAAPALTRTATPALSRTATLALTSTASATRARTTVAISATRTPLPPSRTPVPSDTPAPSATATQPSTPTPEAEASPTATAQAVAVAPDAPGTATTEQPSGAAGYILFGVLVVVLVAGLAVLQLRQQR